MKVVLSWKFWPTFLTDQILSIVDRAVGIDAIEVEAAPLVAYGGPLIEFKQKLKSKVGLHVGPVAGEQFNPIFLDGLQDLISDLEPNSVFLAEARGRQRSEIREIWSGAFSWSARIVDANSIDENFVELIDMQDGVFMPSSQGGVGNRRYLVGIEDISEIQIAKLHSTLFKSPGDVHLILSEGKPLSLSTIEKYREVIDSVIEMKALSRD